MKLIIKAIRLNEAALAIAPAGMPANTAPKFIVELADPTAASTPVSYQLPFAEVDGFEVGGVYDLKLTASASAA
ncbi:hypothetical protein HZY97_20145 [Sphingomonas sp. R-74633]|uniref:hypothetical protein n=1 Tax=Sphingomonas sp. R-74633 TaxID=2751188 RepID=UPI0015D3DA5B|nr:hypothetical protein [Sphingomonas sp. R-74633]NYT43097.1 hypothetical protein [Sphingomonas sp. R-74633]